MFKKPFKVSQSNWMSNKDKKKVTSELKQQFPQDVIELYFKIHDKLQMEKLQGIKMLLYKNEKYPAFIDPQGKCEYIPTIYTIAEFPELIPPIIINQGVEQYILNGANLMWRGVQLQQDLGNFKKDDMRTIVTSEGSLVGLGQMANNSSQANKQEGIAAYSIHYIGDSMWEYGPREVEEPKLTLQKVENEQQIEKTAQSEEDNKLQQSESNSESDNQNLLLQMVEQGSDEEDDPHRKKKKKKKVQDEKKSKQQQPVQILKESKELQQETSDNEQQDEAKDDLGISQEQMDEYIMEAFLNSLKLGVKEKILPIDPSVFYSTLMLIYKKDSVVLDLKRSSYKKIGKFFQQMHKDGLIEYKEAKKGQQPMISNINFQHPTILAWNPTTSKQIKVEEIPKDETYGFKSQIEVTELYKPKQNISFLFRDYPPKEQYYVKDEWKKVVMAYVNKECKWEKRQIKLIDPKLAQLFPNFIEEVIPFDPKDLENQFERAPAVKTRKVTIDNDLIPQDVLLKKIEEGMVKCHEIYYVNTGKIEMRSGEFKGLNITAEKSHNKNITRIVGLEIFGFDPLSKSETNPASFICLQNTFQVKFACSVSIHDSLTKSGAKEMIIHGNFLYEVVKFFSKECQIDEKFIHQVNKLGTKKQGAK